MFHALNCTLVAPLIDPSRAATHYDDCWRVHHACAVAKIEAMMAATPITRVEVIEHRSGLSAHQGVGRIYVAHPCAVTLRYQDDGRTLKVFVDDPTEAT